MISDFNVTSKVSRWLNFVLLPRLVLNPKGKLLHESYPPSVHSVQLALDIDKFQCLMVAIQNKLLLDQIMFPMLQSLDNDIEFRLISSPLMPSLIHFLTEELDGPSL
jgi:hypothetical protein